MVSFTIAGLGQGGERGGCFFLYRKPGASDDFALEFVLLQTCSKLYRLVITSERIL